MNEMTKEKYKCRACDKDFNHNDICNTWECPVCGGKISILIKIKGRKQEAERLRVCELKEGNLFVIGNFTHRILDISATEEDSFRIALKDYRVIHQDGNDFVTIVVGSGSYW